MVHKINSLHVLNKTVLHINVKLTAKNKQLTTRLLLKSCPFTLWCAFTSQLNIVFNFLLSDKPQVTSLTSNQTVNNGFDVSFTCQAEAVPTSITYSWFKDDGSQKLASNSDFVVNGHQLTVKQVKKSSAGRYSCSGTNYVGEGERKSTFLIVNCELLSSIYS